MECLIKNAFYEKSAVYFFVRENIVFYLARKRLQYH